MASSSPVPLVTLLIVGVLLTAPVAGTVVADSQLAEAGDASTTVQSATAQGVLSFNESQVDAASGDTFWLAVRYNATQGNESTSVYGAEFTVKYDPAYVQATQVQQGPYFEQDGTGVLIPFSEIDNSTGEVTYAITSRGDTAGVTGAGSVAYIRFEATQDVPNQTVAEQTISFSGVQVSDPNGNEINTVTEPTTIQSNVRPESSFNVTPSDPSVGDRIVLDATQTTDPDGSIVEYRWDLDGDQQFDDNIGQKINTSFSSAGSYNLSLRTIDNEGANSTSTRQVSVGKETVGLNITANRTNVRVGSTVRFNTTRIDSSERVNATVIVGNESGVTGPDGTVALTAPSAGSFEFVATKQDTATETFQNDSVQIEVFDNIPPEAEFQSESTVVGVNETVTFDASASNDSDGQIVQYEWDLDGDGAFNDAQGESVTTVFSQATTRTIRLRVTDDSGDVATAAQEIQVFNRPTNVSLRPQEATVGQNQTVTYDVVVTNANDGVSSYGVNITVTNVSIGEIINVTNEIGGSATNTISDDGSTATIGALGGDTNNTGSVVIGTVTVSAVAEGTTEVSLSDSGGVSDENGNSYTILGYTSANLTVKTQPPALSGFENKPNDLDSDGLYRDVNGDGQVDVADAQALFLGVLFGDPVVSNDGVYVTQFDINEDGNIDVADAQTLFLDVLFGRA